MKRELARVIKEVVMEKSGENVKKAKDLSDYIRTKGEEEMNCVVEELAQLFKKIKNC